MGQRTMRDFWDRRAEEDAFYFVDNRLEYGAPDLDAFWAGGRRDIDHILSLLDVSIEPTDDVVEIGCGVGRITRVLAERAENVRAIDVSKRMLELAETHNPSLENVSWIQGDGASLGSIADRSADVCFSHVVFQHIPDPEVTLGYVREIGRVLRPGGWAGFQVSNSPSLHRTRPLRERLRSLPDLIRGKRPRGQAHQAWLGSAVELQAVERAASESGAAVERVHGAGTQWCLILLRRPGLA